MDAGKGKISFFQACMIIMLMNGLMSHVIVNPMLLDASGRDAWIAVLFAGILFLPWTILLVIFMRRSGYQKLQPWLAQATNPFFSWVLVLPLGILLYTIGGMTIAHTSMWTITNYLPNTPKLALIIPLTLICFIFAKSGLRVIAIGAGLLLPIVIVLGYFVSLSNTPNKDFQFLKPFFEKGIEPSLNGMIYAGGGFVELIVLLGIQHQIKSKVKAWQIMILAGVIVYISLGPIVGAITEFGPQEAAKQTESPYEQWRLVKLGDYIEHVDFLSIYQWLSGACIRVSFALYILSDLISFRSEKRRIWFLGSVMLSYIVIAMMPMNEYSFYLWMYKIYVPISLISVVSLFGLWFVLSLIRKPQRG
jgi:spore germination protein KB